MGWKSITNLRSTKNEGNTCPKCSSLLYNGETEIPLKSNGFVKIKGKRCIRCNCLYIKNSDEIKSLLKDNTKAKEFTIDGKYYYNESKMKNNNKKYWSLVDYFNSNSAAFVMLTVEKIRDNKFRNDIKEYYVIVSDKSEDNQAKNILHYSNDFAREILAAAFEGEKNHIAIFKNSEYNVGVCYNGKRKLLKEMAFWGIVDEGIYIKKGGGYGNSILTKNKELKEILVYSFLTKRYELMCSTYDENGMNYVDAQIYLNFVRRFGRTKKIVSTYDGSSDVSLNEKSIPAEFGYKVDLTEKERQGILSMLLDYGIVNVDYIVKWLKWNINSMKAKQPDKDSAIHKWDKDLNFVQSYERNLDILMDKEKE